MYTFVTELESSTPVGGAPSFLLRMLIDKGLVILSPPEAKK